MTTTFIFLPPLSKPTGGLAVLHQLAAHLHEQGFAVSLVPRSTQFWSPPISQDVPVTLLDDVALRKEDIWLVPEGWVNSLAPGLNAGARCMVYVQNWAYLFSSLPSGVTWDRLPVSFLAVSDPVAWFIQESVGVDAPVLRPGIDLDLFHPAPSGEDAPRGSKTTVRVAYMPRKNKAHARAIRDIVTARAARRGGPAIEWDAIDGLPPTQVAEHLRRSDLFLATGYPEGCPLPPLEAMASGALCVGFAGLGGFDYMRQAADHPGAYRPWFPLRDTPWGGNGLFVADADVTAAALALEQAVEHAAGETAFSRTVRDAALTTARHYSVDNQRQSVRRIWERLTT